MRHPETQTGYEGKTREELIAEIELLRQRVAAVEHTPSGNKFSSDNELVNTVLNRIEDIVYYAEVLPNGKKALRYISDKVEKVLGIPRDQYISEGASVIKYCHPDDLPGIRETVNRLHDDQQPKTFVYRFEHQRLKEYIWIEESVYPQFDDQGRWSSSLGIIRNVSDRIRSEAALRISEERMHLISDSSPVGIFITDQNGKPVYVNRRAEEISGLPADKILHHAWYRKIHKDDSGKLFRTVREAVAAKSDYSAEFRFHEEDKVRWVKMNVRAIREKDSVNGWVGVVEDITAAKEAETRLSESEQSLSTVLNGISDVLYYRDFTRPANEVVRFVSANIEETLGITREEYLDATTNFQALCHPDDLDSVRAAVQKLWREKTPQTFEYRFFNKKKGEYIWLEERIFPKQDNGKHLANFGVTRDITDWKISEQKLRESEQMLSMVFNTIDDVIYYRELRGDNRRYFISDGIERLTGMSKEEYAVMASGNIESLILADDFHALREAAQNVMREKKPQTISYRMLNRKSGEYRWMEERVVPNIDANGEIIALLGVVRDVHERKTSEEALRQSQQSLGMVLDGIDDVVYFVDYSKRRRDVHFVSSNIEKIFGISREDYVTGKYELMEYCHPDDHEYIIRELADMRATRQPKTFEYRFRHLITGDYFWIEERIYPKFDEAGEMIANFGVSRDITKRKLTEQHIRENQQTLSTVLSNVDEVVHYRTRGENGSSALIFVSEKIDFVLGLTKEEYASMDYVEAKNLAHPDDIKKIEESAERLARERTPTTIIYRFWNKRRGEYLWVEERLVPVISEQGEYVATIGVTRDVTETRAAERLLSESEEKFRMLAENASDIIYRYALQPEPHYEYVSPSAYAITGYTPEEFYQDSYLGFKIVHPEDSDMVSRSSELLQSGVRIRPEQIDGIVTRWIKKNGDIIWAETRNRPIFDSEGKMIAIEGISRDITRQKTDEDALRESEERFRLLSKAAMEGILLIENGRVVDANDRFLSIFGYTSQDELAGKPVDMVITPQHIGTLEDADAGSGVSTYEIKCRRKNGDDIYVEARGNDLPFGGKLVRILTINDITERKAAELALRESERTLSTLMANLPGMAYRCAYDERWTMLFVSKGCEELTGYSPEDLLANHDRSFSDIVHPKDRMVGRDQIEGAIRDRRPFEIQYRIISAQGRVKWVWEKGEGVFDDDGALLFLEGFIADITERKEFEIEVLASRENYKNLIDKSPDGMILMRLNGEALYMNAAMLGMMGVSGIEDLETNKLFDFILPEYRTELNDRLREVASGRDVPFRAIVARRADGNLLELETKPILYDYLGEPALLVFLRDVTTQRQFEKEQMRAQIAEETNRRLQAEIDERIHAQKQLEAAQKYTRLLIESSLDMICASNPDGIITDFNRAAQNTFGYAPEEVIGQPVWMLYSDPDQRIDVLNVLMEGQGVFAGEVVNRKKNGEIFTAFLSASVLRNENGEIIGAMGVSRDITPIKLAEERIRHQAAKLNAIFQSSSHLIYTISRENKITSFNENYAQNTFDNFGYRTFTGHEVDRSMSINLGDRMVSWIEYHQRALSGERLKYVNLVHTTSGTERWYETSLDPIVLPDGSIEEISYIAHEITDKIKAEEQIRRQAAKLNAIFESSSHHIWTINREYRMTSFNQNQATWLKEKYDITAVVGLSLITGPMVSNAQYNEFWKEKLDLVFAGTAQQFETSYVSGKSITWREIYLNPISDDEGRVVEVSCIAHDITDKKHADDRIRQSLKEKEVLLKEVHHRVKNNLQVISSILNLQSSYVKDQKTLELLRESQNRIKSMAFVHESLYQTKDFSSINFSEYVENISTNLVHSYSNLDMPPELVLSTGKIALNLDTAIPCGLIINELLSNAMKYAFPPNKKGKITVDIKSSGSHITIVIADNGKGLPPDIDFRNTDSLGLQLVVTLVEQINGKIKLDNKKGTKFTIDFTIPHT